MSITIDKSRTVATNVKTSVQRLSPGDINDLKRRGYVVVKSPLAMSQFAPGHKSLADRLRVKIIESTDNITKTRKLFRGIRYRFSKSSALHKNYPVISRVNMIKSKHWVEKPVPQVDAFKRMSVLQRFLANDFVEGQIHAYEQAILDSIQDLSRSEVKSEIKKLENIAYSA